MIAAPRFVCRNPVKCDLRVIKITQHFHRLCFVRAVPNIDADPFRVRAGPAIDQRRNQRTNRRHHPVERSRKTDSLSSGPRQPGRFMPLPFRRHPITELGRSLFCHVAITASICSPSNRARNIDCRASAPACRISKRQAGMPALQFVCRSWIFHSR